MVCCHAKNYTLFYKMKNPTSKLRQQKRHRTSLDFSVRKNFVRRRRINVKSSKKMLKSMIFLSFIFMMPTMTQSTNSKE